MTFTATAPTSLVANTASTWTVGFTASSTGALAGGGTITVTFPAGFTTSSTTPTIVLKSTVDSFSTYCTATGADAAQTNVVVITLANASGKTCALANSAAASLTVAVVNGAAGAYGVSNFSVSTSADTTAVAPAAGETITATSVTGVTVSSTAPTSLVVNAASTWTWGFTTSSAGALAAGSTVQLTFPAGFTTLTSTPTVVLKTPTTTNGDFAVYCTASASDLTLTNVIVITLANAAGETCGLNASAAATLTVAVVNGTSAAATGFNLSTSKDATAVAPAAGETLSAATQVGAVSFTTTDPTSLVANTGSTWTVNFSTSSTGSLAAGGYVVAKFPSGFTTTSIAPSIVLTGPSTFASSCTASGVDLTESNVVIIVLSNNGSTTCALGASTTATLTIALVNGPAATYGTTTYSLLTSVDGTAVAPTSGSETVVAAGPPGSGTNWTVPPSASSGEAASAAGPAAPASVHGGALLGFMCASSATEAVDLSWSAAPRATSYVILQSATATGTYTVASPAPVFSGTTATITYTTAGTEYFKVEAQVGSAWVSVPSGNATDGLVSPGFVVTATASPKCTNN